MSLNKMVCTATLALASLTPITTAPLQAGIIDFVCNALARKAPQEPPATRVLLAHDVPGVILEVKGKYKVYNPHNNEQISKSFLGKRRFIQALTDGLRWGEEFPGVHQIMIVPTDPKTTMIVDGIEYQGTLYVYDVGGSISVVNKINTEEYLSTILPLRYSDSLPEELLAAIVIAERTNCYYRMQNNKTGFWDVDAKREEYHGYALSRKKSIDDVLAKTRYIMLQRCGEGAFALDWEPKEANKRFKGTTYSSISLAEADKMAQKGKNAADILRLAFPSASLKLNHAQSS